VLVVILFFNIPDNQLSYLWYNPIGCAACLVVSSIVQVVFGAHMKPPGKIASPA
jgi:hypothetical protein